jgi:hypothetical protein
MGLPSEVSGKRQDNGTNQELPGDRRTRPAVDPGFRIPIKTRKAKKEK